MSKLLYSGISGAGVTALGLIFSLLPVSGLAQSLSELDTLTFQPVAMTGGRQLAVNEPLSGLAADQVLAGISSPREANYRSGVDITGSLQEELQTVEQYLQAISEKEHQAGPYAPGLKQDLLVLGTLYQQNGEHEQALDVLQRAAQISRVNNGLYSPELIDIVEQNLSSLLALARRDEATEQQEYLLYLHQKSFGANDIRTVPALARLASWNIDAFRNDILRESRGIQQMNGSAGPLAQELEVQSAAIDKLQAAQRDLIRGIEVLVENQAYQLPLLKKMEEELVETYFLMAFKEEILADPENILGRGRFKLEPVGLEQRAEKVQDFRNGENAYKRVLYYLQSNPDANVEDYAQTLLSLGDWYLLFGKRSDGLATYKKAHELLNGAPVDTEVVDHMMHPGVPVILPTFASGESGIYLAQRDDSLNALHQGFIDVSFRLNKYGRATHVETLEKSPETGDNVESELLWMVRDSQFRPRLQNGAPVDEDELTLRYYYRY